MTGRLTDRYPQARDFTLPGGSTAVLMIHGFTATPAQMRRLGGYLGEQGYTVRGMLLPGHGATVEDMLQSGWQQWLSAARTEALRLMQGHQKLVVLGLSMGGLLALLLAEELPVDGVVSLAAAIRVRNKLAPLARILAPLGPKTLGGPGERTEPDDIGYGVTPVRKVGDLMTLARMARAGLDRIHCPMLVVQSRLDQSVDARAPEIILGGAVNCFDKDMLWLESSPHVCTYGPELPILSQKVGSFLKRIDELDPIE